jgi:hypothetical protein
MLLGRRTRLLAAALLVLAVAGLLNMALAEETKQNRPPRKSVKLPGMVVDLEKRCVDVEATICLDDGFLEVVACTKGSKEHESIVAVDARPMHIHTALLLLGAKNGNPAMRKAANKEMTRWVHLPPRGDPIEVFLVLKNSEGELTERPIRDFIVRAEDRAGAVAEDRGASGKAEANGKFPTTFLFAGSHLRDVEKGPRQYLADHSGNVISISTFGDELLCLPIEQSHANGALVWQVNSTHLPKVGTKVTLRLRPKTKQATGAVE